jgi:hypothetical protein
MRFNWYQSTVSATTTPLWQLRPPDFGWVELVSHLLH